MAFNPVTGQDIRIVYNADRRSLDIEQVRIRRANGASHPSDRGAIVDLDQERWELRAIATNIDEALKRALSIMVEENVLLREVNLGPIPPQASTVAAALNELRRVRL